jgi:hypothetical protein
VCQPNAIRNALGYAKFFSRSHDAVIRVYDEAGNVIETHEQAGDFKECYSRMYSFLQTASILDSEAEQKLRKSRLSPRSCHLPADYMGRFCR